MGCRIIFSTRNNIWTGRNFPSADILHNKALTTVLTSLFRKITNDEYELIRECYSNNINRVRDIKKLTVLCDIFIDNHLFSHADECANRILSINNLEPFARYTKGRVELAYNHLYSARTHFNDIPLNDPNRYYGHALVDLKQIDMESALANFKEMVKLSNNSTIALTNLGNTYLYFGNIKKAKESYVKAMKIEDDNHRAIKGLAHIAIFRKDIQEAKMLLSKIKYIELNCEPRNLDDFRFGIERSKYLLNEGFIPAEVKRSLKESRILSVRRNEDLNIYFFHNSHLCMAELDIMRMTIYKFTVICKSSKS